MPRLSHLASALALALIGTSAAQAQTFSGVITFGDSLSDAGNVAALSGLPAGNSFTTNPDPVYAQIVAASFGFNQSNFSPYIPGSSGSNWAVGGACARANSASFTCVNDPSGAYGLFSVTNQITAYLTANGGHADPNALYTVWAGANDIFTAAGNPATAQLNTGIAAATTVGLIGTLQAAGARTIVVFNLPDLGLTPDNIGTAAQAGATGLSFVYNTTFNDSLASLGDGIVPINTFGLINEIIADPSLYGFTDVTHKACGAGSSSVACGPEGSPLPFHYANGTNETYLFADSVHPTGAAHAILANVVVATISAPGQVSLAGEVPLQVYSDHAGAINNRLFGLQGAERADGDTAAWGDLQFGKQKYKATPGTAAMDNNAYTLSFGADYRLSETTTLGAALSFGRGNSNYGAGNGAGVDGREVLASVYGNWTFGGAHIDAIVTGGSNSLSIDRAIVMGPTVRTESGSTDAQHTAFELGGGYLFQAGGLQHGPFASVTWQKVDVNGYAEDSTDSTGMWFADFTRKSQVGRIGYELKGDSGSVHPYARVAWAKEDKADASAVQAGSNSMNGHFTLSGFLPADKWVEADLGLAYDVNETAQFTVAYRGHLNDDSQSRDSINLGFRMSF